MVALHDEELILTFFSVQQILVMYLNGVPTVVDASVAPSTSYGNVLLGGRGQVVYFLGRIADVSLFKVPIGAQHVQLAIATAFPQAPDTSNPFNGPNHMDCLNFGVRVDGMPNDGRYTCDCSKTGYSGSNCQIVPPPLSQLQFEVCRLKLCMIKREFKHK